MLKDNFYTISDFNVEGESVSAKVELDANHDIFKGHFPSTPVTPGVCLSQMIVDVVGRAKESKLFLKEGKQIKFLQPVVPSQGTSLLVEATLYPDKEDVSATIKQSDVVCVKFKGVLAKSI